MLLRIMCINVLVNILMYKCEEKMGNLTVKYGNKTEIHFQIKDPNSKLLEMQLEMMRLEQIRQGAILDELAEATALSRRSGAYQIIVPAYSVHSFIVSCDEDTQGGGWTIVLRRMDGSVDFFLFWKDYQKGFGNVNGEFFIGLDKLHALTKQLDQELLIVMEDFKGQHRFAKYNRFAIDGVENAYKLTTLGEYSGDAGDSLKAHVGAKFSAQDQDNDIHKDNCARLFTGGWWYSACHVSNLMGKYNDSTFGKGINWLEFTTHTASLKSVQMMIRPKRY